MKFKVLLAAVVSLSTVLFAGVTRSDEQKSSTPAKTAPAQPKETSLIKPEVDKTDIFAIPEDEDEEEESEDEQSLEKLQKYEQNKDKLKAEKPAAK